MTKIEQLQISEAIKNRHEREMAASFYFSILFLTFYVSACSIIQLVVFSFIDFQQIGQALVLCGAPLAVGYYIVSVVSSAREVSKNKETLNKYHGKSIEDLLEHNEEFKEFFSAEESDGEKSPVPV